MVDKPEDPSSWSPQPGLEPAGTVNFADANDPAKDSYWLIRGFEQGYNRPIAVAEPPAGPIGARQADLFNQGSVLGQQAAIKARDEANAAYDDDYTGPAWDGERNGESLEAIRNELFEEWSRNWRTDEQPDVEREEFDPMWSTAPQWSGQVGR